MAIGDWANTDLCIDRDLVRIERKAMDWTKPQGDAGHWRSEAKRQIGEKLRRGLHAEQLTATEDEILDLISNPESLLTCAIFLTLHLIANDRMAHPQDFYAAKAAHYLNEFEKEFPQAKSDLHFDSDESGAITDGEKFNVPTGVKIQRGV